jgi:hypothetical protein
MTRVLSVNDLGFKHRGGTLFMAHLRTATRCSPARPGGIVATSAVLPGGTLDAVGNKIATSGVGIVVGADATVDSNAVNKLGGSAGSDGIVVAAGGFPAAPGHVRITGNRVHDRAGTGIALRTAVRTFMVKENIVADVGAGIAIEGKGSAERVAVGNNELFDVAAKEGTATALGILLTHAVSAGVVGNTVSRVGLGASSAGIRVGIGVLAVDDIHVSGNVVDEIGRSDGFLGLASGIVVVGPFEAVSVSDNSSRFSAQRAAPTDGSWNALLIQSAGAGNLVHFGAGKAVVPVTGGAVVLTTGWAFAAAARSDHAGVASNTLSGGGGLPTCFVRVAGDVVVQGNQCAHDDSQQPTAAFIEASAITASSNRVRTGKSMLVLKVNEARFAALGNLASGGTHLNTPGAGLPVPWKPLNPNVS